MNRRHKESVWLNGKIESMVVVAQRVTFSDRGFGDDDKYDERCRCSWVFAAQQAVLAFLCAQAVTLIGYS